MRWKTVRTYGKILATPLSCSVTSQSMHHPSTKSVSMLISRSVSMLVNQSASVSVRQLVNVLSESFLLLDLFVCCC